MGEVVVAMKLDIAKAYDKMEWNYIDGVMIAMGFATRWVKLVMKCVKTVRFNIVLGQT